MSAPVKPAYTQVIEPRLPGRDRYLGGELCVKTGDLYCVPGSAQRVLKINPETDEVSLIGPELPGKFKWLRAVYCPNNGRLFSIPSCASQMLMIDPTTDEVRVEDCR